MKNAHAGIFGEENTAVSVDMFAWAISTVLSRALNKENSFYSFMPGVDLLNHDAERKLRDWISFEYRYKKWENVDG